MITLGSDPEMFTKIGSNFVPAYVALGRQDSSFELPYGELEGDGAAIEFTTSVANCAVNLTRYIRENLLKTRDLVKELSESTLSAAPSADFREWIPIMDTSYSKRCSLQVLGCDPDLCAYNDPFERPNPVAYPLRTTGGHIHFGVGPLVHNQVFVYYAVAALDRTLGLLSTIHDASPEAQNRKELYGRAGYYRLNPIIQTLEYRTMPANALIHDPQITLELTSLADLVVSWYMNNAGQLKTMHESLGGYKRIKQCQEAIDAHDIEKCRELFIEYMQRSAMSCCYNETDIEDLVSIRTGHDINFNEWEGFTSC